MAREVKTKGYVLTYVALIALTLISFAASYAGPGPLETAIALAIACVKTGLVALIFMHLIEERFASGLIAITAGLLLILLVALTTADVLSRTTFPRAPMPPPSDPTPHVAPR